MKPNIRLIFAILVNLGYVIFMIWLGYSIWTGKYPWFAIFLLFALFFNWPRVITAYSRTSVEDDNYFVDLSRQVEIVDHVTPELIKEILDQQDIVQIIKNDLGRTNSITYKEEWRLGLITPDLDLIKIADKITPKRTAILHSTDYFKPNNIAIAMGDHNPKGFHKWSYGLKTQLNKGDFINLKKIEIDDTSTTKHRSKLLPEFLKEDGFPLKESYLDGDPFTTDRGGTIVVDKGKLIIIYPRYFVQRRLIDDDGNLVNLGIDESFGQPIMFKVMLQPSVSRLLIKRTSKKSLIPIVRYRSFPYASDFMLPLLDTPMSASGWADLFIDNEGKGKLFFSKNKTEAEWYEMMNRLKQLLLNELARKNYHLLGLTKDKTHLNEYLSKKQGILADYFIIHDWKLPK